MLRANTCEAPVVSRLDEVTVHLEPGLGPKTLISLLPYAPTKVIEPVTTVYLASTVVSSVSTIPPGSIVIVPMLFIAASSA